MKTGHPDAWREFDLLSHLLSQRLQDRARPDLNLWQPGHIPPPLVPEDEIGDARFLYERDSSSAMPIPDPMLDEMHAHTHSVVCTQHKPQHGPMRHRHMTS